MQLKHFTILSLSILSLGLAVGCTTQPKADVNPATNQTAPSSTTPVKTTKSTSAAPSNRVNFYTENGVAIRGTDPVAYFQQGQPVQGNSKFSHQWMNATWHFASAENRDLFAKNPDKYAPQYGGFCAWAVSRGYSAPIDPNAWRIVDGKLYLNYDKSVQRSWERNIPDNISKANRNWPNVLKSLNK
jgi:YHS domain-containing protein